MNRLILFFLACIMTQFSYAQQELTIKEMEDSMALGNLNIQVDLATEYIRGNNVAKDYAKAYSLIRDAAEKGNRYGQLMLSICYEDGIGVEKNLEESFRWCLRSAEQGNILAQLNVGKLYEHGRGVERNLKKAFEWTSLSAQQYAGAKFVLAQYHFNGWGTEPDKVEALRLMNSLKDDENLGEAASHYSTIIERGDTMSTYGFQFRWIPSMLFEWQKGNVEDEMLTDITEWQLDLGEYFISHYEWDWSAVSSQVYHQSNDIDIIVYRMPEPQTPPLCQYAAAVIDRKKHTVQYFTLELSYDLSGMSSTKPWMFCGVGSEMTHFNYGWFEGPVTEQHFILKVKQHVAKQEKRGEAKKEKKDEDKKDKKGKVKRPQEEVIQAINDSICAEGYNLYIAEKLNWISTDSVFAHYNQDELGGNLIWQPTDSTWSAIFYDKDIKSCIFELNYNRINGMTSLSYDQRPITETEQAQVKMKRIMLKNAIENYGDKLSYDKECGNPNFDFVRINDDITRLYVLQGTNQRNMIPFGNDYSIDFDNNGNTLCFRKYHNSLIAMKTVDDEGNKVESVIHSHLPDNPYITPTDVCNFLLYRGPLKAHYILSTALDGYIIHIAEYNSAHFLTSEQMGKNQSNVPVPASFEKEKGQENGESQ